LLLSVLGGGILGAIAGLAGEGSRSMVFDWGMAGISALMGVFYFWRINAHLKFINA